MEYVEAVDLLKSPRTWCEGAKALAAFGDSQGLLPLIRAYEMRVEASRACLLDAMDALDPPGGALALAEETDPETRRLGLHLMELFPDQRYVQTLENVIRQESGALRRQALRSLITQLQTPDWEAALIRLLDSDDEAVRTTVVESLSRRRTATAHQALQDHLPQESSQTLQNKIRESR